MMKFSKSNQPRRYCGGRKPDPNSKAGKKRAAKAAAEQQRQANALAVFEEATTGPFNGFNFAEAFHRAHDKREAIEVLTTDDCGEVTTSAGQRIRAGADGITVYIMSSAARAGQSNKRVEFNRSLYIF